MMIKNKINWFDRNMHMEWVEIYLVKKKRLNVAV